MVIKSRATREGSTAFSVRLQAAFQYADSKKLCHSLCIARNLHYLCKRIFRPLRFMRCEINLYISLQIITYTYLNMKKRFHILWAAVLVLCCWAQAATVPYNSEIGGATSLDDGWTVIDLDNDGKTWVNDNYPANRGYDVAGTSHGVIMQWDRNNAKNDLLITPAIHLDEGQDYKITFWIKTSSDPEDLKLLMSDGNQASNFANAVELATLSAYTNTAAFERKTVTFTNRGEGDYHFAFKATSPAYMGYIYLTGFAIGVDAVTPAAVTGLTAALGAGDALTVDLSWTLPTLADDGQPLAAGTITGVRITRDGQLLTTLAADATSWHDSQATGLTAGVHTYEVAAVAGPAVGLPARVTTGYVGALPEQALPWTSDLSSAEAVGDLWTIIKGPNSTQTKQWTYNASSFAPYFGFSALDGVEDDYLITPPLRVEHAGAYKVTFEWLAGYYQKERLELLVGRGRSIAALDRVVDTFTSKNNYGSRQTYEATFEASEPGTYYLALHACSSDIESRQGYGDLYNIYSIHVESNTIVPAPVADLAATPVGGESLDVTLTWTNPSTTNAGGPLDALTHVEVLRAPVTGTGYARRPGEWAVVATVADAAVGQPTTVTDAVPQPGYYAYRVLPWSSGGCAEGEPATVFTPWVGDHAQPLPYDCTFDDQSHFLEFYTVVDANADSNTFGWTQGYQVRFDHNDVEADDWLVTPPFNLEPGYYKLTLGYLGNGSHFAVGTTASATEPATAFAQLTDVSVTDYGNFTDELMFHVDAAGKRHIAIHDISGEQAGYLQIKRIALERSQVLPDVATQLTATAEGRSVVLKWTNPSTTNVPGEPLTAIDHVTIVRNGEPVALLTEGLTPGLTASYTDTVPAVGPYTYSVEVYTAAGKSDKPAPTVTLDWVGGGLDLPFTANFADPDEWTIVNANGDSQTYTDEFGTWTEPFTWAVNGSNLYYGFNNREADDWAMSPRLELPQGKSVRVTITSSTGSGHDVGWQLAIAPAIDHTQMTPVASLTTATGIVAGDLNADGKSDIEDVNALINELLGHTTATAGATADLSGDGRVDVEDVNLLINLTLGYDTDAVAMQRNVVTITGQAGTRVLGLHAIQAGDLVIHSLKVETAD